MDLLSQPSLDGLTASKAFVRDLEDGQQIESPFLVRDRTRREKRNGEPFLKLQLGDVTGMVEAVLWDGVDEAMEATAPGSVVVVAGRYEVKDRYGACITLRSVREAADGSFDPADLHDAPPVPFDRMVADLRALVDTVQDRDLRALLDRFLSEDCALWQRWSQWPAASTTEPGTVASIASSTPSHNTASTIPVTSPSWSFRNGSPLRFSRRERSRTRNGDSIC